MYPRINRQVSSITLQSILAAQIEVAGGMSFPDFTGSSVI